MDITLEPASKPSQSLHLLPCHIEYTGSAKVSSYFVQTRATDPATGGPCTTAAFRGRQLFGTVSHLPPGYKGCVYAERVDHETDGLDEEADVTHECIEQFDEFTVWKHDSAPDTKTDPFFVAMEWSNISSHLHTPIPI
ncbi:unnamed protein product [Umbelopsis vinacea]